MSVVQSLLFFSHLHLLAMFKWNTWQWTQFYIGIDIQYYAGFLGLTLQRRFRLRFLTATKNQ